MSASVLVAFGTRPEAIKMAPVVDALRARPDDFQPIVAVTGQHREMLDQVLELFDIEPAYDLEVMTPGQSLAELTSRVVDGFDRILEDAQPDAVLVQGDTTTTFVAALASFYRSIPVGHVEAGLRTGDRRHPFPEEINRRLTTVLAEWHFAPTEVSKANLLSEGIAAESILVSGNTVIDALLAVAGRPFTPPPGPVADALTSGGSLVLMTMHRRESWGAPLREACDAARELTDRFDDVRVLFCVHLNPEVQRAAAERLGDADRVHLVGPQDYRTFVALMQASTLILSDSGGVQEEAPSLGKPVLVLRDVTERPEALEAGTVRLVGRDRERIVAEASTLLTDRAAYDTMARASNPFGDGVAGKRIAAFLADRLGTCLERGGDDV